MRKKRHTLRIILIILCFTLAFPVYYVTDLIITAAILKKFQHAVKTSRPAIEYFSFANLESVIKRTVNGTKYTIYAFANHTKGSAVLERDEKQNITIQSTDIMNVYGTIKNQETQDIYNFKSASLGISNANTLVKMYKNFYINLQIQEKQTTLEMRGDHLLFDIKESSILSNDTVIFNTENAILVGGSFYYKDGTARLVKDIFLDMERVFVTSDVMEVQLGKGTLLNGNQKEVSFSKAIFTGNVKMFDKIENVYLYADLITVDNTTKVATLEGNAVIERPDGKVSGSVMTYRLSEGYAEIRSGISSKTGKKERVTVKIKY